MRMSSESPVSATESARYLPSGDHAPPAFRPGRVEKGFGHGGPRFGPLAVAHSSVHQSALPVRYDIQPSLPPGPQAAWMLSEPLLVTCFQPPPSLPTTAISFTPCFTSV